MEQFKKGFNIFMGFVISILTLFISVCLGRLLGREAFLLFMDIKDLFQ